MQSGSDELQQIREILQATALQQQANAQAIDQHNVALDRLEAMTERNSQLIESNARAIEAWRTELMERQESEREEHLESEGVLEGQVSELGERISRLESSTDNLGERMTSLEQTIQSLINVLGTMMGEITQIWERLRAG